MTHTTPVYTLDDYRNAPSGVGPLAVMWNDKPHRLIYDLIQRISSGRDDHCNQYRCSEAHTCCGGFGSAKSAKRNDEQEQKRCEELAAKHCVNFNGNGQNPRVCYETEFIEVLIRERAEQKARYVGLLKKLSDAAEAVLDVYHEVLKYSGEFSVVGRLRVAIDETRPYIAAQEQSHGWSLWRIGGNISSYSPGHQPPLEHRSEFIAQGTYEVMELLQKAMRKPGATNEKQAEREYATELQTKYDQVVAEAREVCSLPGVVVGPPCVKRLAALVGIALETEEKKA